MSLCDMEIFKIAVVQKWGPIKLGQRLICHKEPLVNYNQRPNDIFEWYLDFPSFFLFGPDLRKSPLYVKFKTIHSLVIYWCKICNKCKTGISTFIQGVFFNWCPPKNHKFFSVSKFWHLELFCWYLPCNLTLRTFRGAPVKKDALYLFKWYSDFLLILM